MTTVLGIDPSVSSTGFGLLELGPGASLLDVGRIRHDLTKHKGMSVIAKTGSLFFQLVEYMGTHDIDIVVVENIRISAKLAAKNGDATNKTIRAQQTAVLAAVHCQLPVYEVEATRWRKLIKCGAANRDKAKEKVRVFVNTKFADDLERLGISYTTPPPIKIAMPGINPTLDDMSDAIGIALTGLVLQKESEK